MNSLFDTTNLELERITIKRLREHGVMMLHPYNWSVCDNCLSMTISSPVFNDNPRINDLIALGDVKTGYDIYKIIDTQWIGNEFTLSLSLEQERYENDC